MKLVFAGTPEYAAIALDAVLQAGHEVVLVLTRPDRPAGRGLKPQLSAVKRLALNRDLALSQPDRLSGPAVLEALVAAAPDAIVVVAYGLMLPAALLTVPPRGCINVHASLLPRWRGAAPIQRALLAGDAETGVSIMQMDAGLDTGPILLQRSIPIAADDTAGALHDRLAALGAAMLVEALASDPSPRAQDAAAATYASRIGSADAEIDWRQPAVAIERQLRALDPAPGARTGLNGMVLKLWRGVVEPRADASPGTVSTAGPDGIVVACGEGALRVIELQRAGGRRLSAQAFLSGFSLARGSRLGRPRD